MNRERVTPDEVFSAMRSRNGCKKLDGGIPNVSPSP
jgi:hypothetical protein